VPEEDMGNQCGEEAGEKGGGLTLISSVGEGRLQLIFA